ncbi:hypothetical protein Cni_G15423 [Canna indica]|uniref:BZIP domain-containing protein n=1 Tax=Canna indica TaxID=4628 RepID=A0AAQ3QD92_9LILI|nr:hypothetical protein Cni_G15423 [Canna indica]
MSSLPIRPAKNTDGSHQPETDERKRKRMLSNRASARRSRMRKQQRLDDLINQSADLKNQNSKIEMQISLLTLNTMKVDAENAVLKAQLMELTERLRSLNSVLSIFEEVIGMPMDKPEIPEQVLKPWQPYPAQPISATADMFLF